MKIIHCADLHIGSKLNTNFDRETAKQRQEELLNTFKRMLRYAEDEVVDAIIIAGDLFDETGVSKGIVNEVISEIEKHSDVSFFYLSGNHDIDLQMMKLVMLPDNLYMFKEDWMEYEFGNKVVILGKNTITSDMYDGIVLDENTINIVVLHGQISEYDQSGNKEIINLRGLKNRNIDYLALGHIHRFGEGKIDARGSYVYSGCLEGRGFDECGEHGFVLLDIDEKLSKLSYEFIPFAYRNFYEVTVDITGCMNEDDIVNAIRKALTLEYYDELDIIKVVLVGEVDFDVNVDVELFNKMFKEQYYLFKVKNSTVIRKNHDGFMADWSLKGEFIRTVNGRDDICKEDRERIIKYGLKALALEEIEDED